MYTNQFKRSLFSLLIFSVLVLTAIPTLAQERVYEEGSVWDVSYVRTEPGQFDTYLANLEQVWKQVLDRAIESGDVLSYKVISAQAAFSGDWDLMLLTEYPNMAALDGIQERMDPIVEEVIGSMSTVSESTVERRKLREILGGKIARELIFIE